MKRRGKIQRGLIIMASAAGSITDLAQGMWRSQGRKHNGVDGIISPYPRRQRDETTYSLAWVVI